MVWLDSVCRGFNALSPNAFSNFSTSLSAR
ncbi:hypothetical protein CYFUS_006376 [Cystobacter fuscus]|uniref:Uncharacterized protein n=1 Tax=Cystobacter fuscus TaxID=43 RepID=A0A250JAH0_9BACT|nr:hypothetical protein CYFUS_006376 [Cystobacter fuscus]